MSDLERGLRTRPYRDTVYRIADALGLDDTQRLELVIAARQGSYRGPLRGSTPASHQIASGRPDTPSPPLTWEREEVIAACARLVSRTRAGAGGALFVIADAGLGKTTVLNHVCQSAIADLAVGFCRGNPAETSLPFGLMTQVLDKMGAHELLLGQSVRELQTVSENRAVQFHRVLRWLEITATSRPMLLAVDDLHWADADSLALLSFICRRAAALPVAVIGTLRSWPPETREMVRNLTREQSIGVEWLKPLSEPAATALLSARIGHTVADEQARAAWHLCAGNPLLLEQIAPTVGHGEALGDAVWAQGINFSDQLLLQNFAELPAEALQYARVGSVLGTQFRADVAAEVAQLDDGEVDAALDILNRSGLLHEGESGRLEFVHPLFCQALYKGLGAGTRLRFHARAFTVLAQRGLEKEAAEHAKRAHLAGDRAAIRVLEHVGQAALRTGALVSAASHLQTAVELAGDLAGAELLLELGEALLAGGRPAEAVSAYERVLSLDGVSDLVRSEALRMLGRALFAMGLPERSAAQFEAAATLVEVDNPVLAGEAVLDQALAAWVALGPARALELAVRARELCRFADNATRRRAVAAHALIALQAGDGSGLDSSAEAARVVARDPMTSLNDLCWTWGVLQTHSVAAVHAERFSEAQELLDAAGTAAERIGASEAMASLGVTQAVLLTRIGRLHEALQQITRATDLTNTVPFLEATAASFRADILFECGHVEESEWWCARAEAAARERHQSMPHILVAHVRAERCILNGMLPEACALYSSVEQMSQNLGIADPCTYPWARSAIAAFLEAGRTDNALHVLDWVEQCSRRLPCRWPRIVIESAKAMLAERRGQVDSAENHYQMAFALHDEVSLPLEHLRTLVDFGHFLKRTRRTARAREVLSEVLFRADRIGAAQLAARVRVDLNNWK